MLVELRKLLDNNKSIGPRHLRDDLWSESHPAHVEPVLELLGYICFRISVDHGFWQTYTEHCLPFRNEGEALALIHSEVSECLEAIREKKPQEDVAEELADIIIRVLDFAYGFGYNYAEALTKKMLKNAQRPFKHNKAF